jgi:2-iminoacetate synthase
LYLSNECINNCQYCGFSRDNPILRVTLTLDEIRREVAALKRIRASATSCWSRANIPASSRTAIWRDCVAAIRDEVPGISLEVGPMAIEDYQPLVAAGAEGLVVYQETYDRAVYDDLHTAGPKKDFNWRMETPERAYAAGFKRLGHRRPVRPGDWRHEALCVAAHARHLLRHCWKAGLTISVPRLRPCAGEFQPLTHLADRDLVQLICAFRLFLPDVGLVLSTREPARLRDGLIPLGITLMSAGSHTEPGGYTGAGKERIHYTEKGRVMPLAEGASEWDATEDRSTNATGQFDIADHRSPAEMAERLRAMGYEPVWKDWDTALAATTADGGCC